jgi:hypothetical protein
MRSHVAFKTPRFNQTEVQPHFINPCRFGEDWLFRLIDVNWHLEEVSRRGGSPGAADPSGPRTAGESA